MGVTSSTVVIIAAAALTAGGCSHQRLAWPPTQADVARINEEAAERNGWLRVEFAEPTRFGRGAHEDKPVAIESVDAEQMTVRTRAGETFEFPARLITGVTVKDQSRGAFIGGSIGFTAGIAEVGGWWLLTGAPPGAADCFVVCNAQQAALVIGTSVLAGVVLGLFIKAKHTYDFAR